LRPTARELIENVAASLERDVSPHVADKWAASALRSAVQLLTHLATRVENEQAVLIEDNADIRQVLESSRVRMAAYPGGAEWRRAIDQVLAAAEPAPHDAVGLDRRNDEYQRVVELLLRDRPALHALPTGQEIHADLRRYLQRRLEREHAVYFPAFTGAPF
jgi:hypothetical protein